MGTAKDNKSLATKLLKNKYGNFLRPYSQSHRSYSTVYKDFEICKTTLTKGACKLIGTRDNTKIRFDLWIPQNEKFKPTPKESANINHELIVKNLMKNSHNEWNVDILTQLFDQQTVKIYQKIYFS